MGRYDIKGHFSLFFSKCSGSMLVKERFWNPLGLEGRAKLGDWINSRFIAFFPCQKLQFEGSYKGAVASHYVLRCLIKLLPTCLHFVISVVFFFSSYVKMPSCSNKTTTTAVSPLVSLAVGHFLYFFYVFFWDFSGEPAAVATCFPHS